jgi:hypothetical protein
MKYAYVQFLCNRIANRLVVYNMLILQQQIIGYVPFLNSQVPIPSRVNEVWIIFNQEGITAFRRRKKYGFDLSIQM